MSRVNLAQKLPPVMLTCHSRWIWHVVRVLNLERAEGSYSLGFKNLIEGFCLLSRGGAHQWRSGVSFLFLLFLLIWYLYVNSIPFDKKCMYKIEMLRFKAWISLNFRPGVELKPGKPYTHRFDGDRGRLHVSQVCFEMLELFELYFFAYCLAVRIFGIYFSFDCLSLCDKSMSRNFIVLFLKFF